MKLLAPASVAILSHVRQSDLHSTARQLVSSPSILGGPTTRLRGCEDLLSTIFPEGKNRQQITGHCVPPLVLVARQYVHLCSSSRTLGAIEMRTSPSASRKRKFMPTCGFEALVIIMLRQFSSCTVHGRSSYFRSELINSRRSLLYHPRTVLYLRWGLDCTWLSHPWWTCVGMQRCTVTVICYPSLFS
jgi:hypothetical protein